MKEQSRFLSDLMRVVGALGFIVIVIYSIYTYKQHMAQRNSYVIQQSEQALSEIDSFFKVADSAISTISQKTVLYVRNKNDESLGGLHDISRMVTDLHNWISQAIILDKEGHPITSSDFINPPFGLFSHSETLSYIAQSEHVEITTPIISLYGITHSQEVILIGKKIVDLNGDHIGFVIFTVFPDVFFTQKIHKNLINYGILELKTKDGVLIADAGRRGVSNIELGRNYLFNGRFHIDTVVMKKGVLNSEYLKSNALITILGTAATILIFVVGLYLKIIRDKEEREYIYRLEEEVESRTLDLQEINKKVEETNRELEQLNHNLEAKVEEGIEKYRQQEVTITQQSKMAAMGEMIGVIAHQWKQPLSAVSLTVQSIQDDIKYKDIDWERFNKNLSSILQQTKHMNKTINDFRDFFKPTREQENFMPCEAVNDVYALIEAQLKHHNVEINIAEHEHFSSKGYPNEFKQVVLNIVTNALQVFEEKSVSRGVIECNFSNDKKTGKISIKDNGGGIDETLLPDKLFESYISTKGDKGTGIGLQISKIIVEEKMHGKLWAKNVDDGAEFIIELPIVEETEKL